MGESMANDYTPNLWPYRVYRAIVWRDNRGREQEGNKAMNETKEGNELMPDYELMTYGGYEGEW
jgi:hypothetical protein